jgi:DNA-binding GntR family transcriptional regulator
MSRQSPLATRSPATLVPLWNVRKGDAAYHAVRRSILLGHLAAGEQLLEQRIAEQLNCSQGTIREALLRLEQDGLVARRGYRGTFVSTTSVPEVAQMFELRVQLECAGIHRTTPSIGAEVLGELTALTEEMDKAVRARDYYQCSELDRAFHMVLFRQAALPSLEPILNRSTLHIHRFTYLNAEDTEPESTLGENHRALLRVIRSGDPMAASEAIVRHIEHVIDRWAPPVVGELERSPFTRFARYARQESSSSRQIG